VKWVISNALRDVAFVSSITIHKYVCFRESFM